MQVSIQQCNMSITMKQGKFVFSESKLTCVQISACQDIFLGDRFP